MPYRNEFPNYVSDSEQISLRMRLNKGANMLSKIHNLLAYCYEDNKIDKLPGIELQLFLIAVKSLMPYEDNIGCLFDVTRYEKEVELFKCYKNGIDDNLEFYYENKKPSEKEDELLEFKIIPVIIANTQWNNLLNEALKVAVFYSINSNTILNTILISSTIDEYLNQNYVDIESINETTKERLINFSLKDFLNNNNIQINKRSLIEFEKERIKILSKNELIDVELKEKFKALKYIYNEITTENAEIISETVLTSFSSYLLKLRKGVINPEKLKIPYGNVPEFKEFLKYSAFNHPLLGKCNVLKRGEKEVILRTKSGLIKVNI